MYQVPDITFTTYQSFGDHRHGLTTVLGHLGANSENACDGAYGMAPHQDSFSLSDQIVIGLHVAAYFRAD